MHHALDLASRIMAGIVAAVAFYFAFFLFEDEEGVWQNRIENLWASIHDRARVTDTTSTALLNKLGDLFRRLFKSIYGEKLLSLRAIAVSTDLSIAGALFIPLLSLILIYCIQPSGPDLPPPYFSYFVAIGFCLSVVCGILPIFFKNRFALAIALLPGIAALIFLGYRPTIEHQPLLALCYFAAFVASFASDLLSIIVLRRFSEVVSRTVSLISILLQIIALVAVIVVIEGAPVVLTNFLVKHLPVPYAQAPEATRDTTIFDAIMTAEFLNVTTAILCLLPVLVLMFLLLHRLFGRCSADFSTRSHPGGL
jgi:hypothetical protein